MTQGPISSIKYDPSELEFLYQNFGLEDPSVGDRRIEWNEIPTELQSFYRELSSEEQQALSDYRLSSTQVSQSRHLSSVAKKFLKWRFHSEYAFDFSVDTLALEAPSLDPFRIFHKLIIDAQGFRRFFRRTQDLPLGFAERDSIRMLKAFVYKHKRQNQLGLTRDAWGLMFTAEGLSERQAERSWNDLLSMWQQSELRWNPLVNDYVLGTPLNGFVRYASSDMRVTPTGLRALLDSRSELRPDILDLPDETRPRVSVDQMSIQDRAIWPDHPTRIPLVSKMGISLNLSTSPGATMVVNQNIQQGDMTFDVTQPLIRLEGFQLNVDANSWLTRGIASLGQTLLAPTQRDFDVGFYDLTAVTVFQNRLCFVFRGGVETNDIYQPLPDDEFLFIDVTQLFKEILDQTDSSLQLSEGLIDENGDIREEIPVDQLQEDLVSAFRHFSVPEALSDFDAASFQGLNNQLWINGIQVDVTDTIPNSLLSGDDSNQGPLSIEYAMITDGDVHANISWPEAIQAEGWMQLQLQVQIPYIDQTEPQLNLDVEFKLDSALDLAIAKVTIPPVYLDQIGSQIDGLYDGEIYIALDPELFYQLDPQTLQAEDLLKSLQAEVLLDLRKNHSDYLSAVVYWTYSQESDDVLHMREIMSRYQIAFSDGDQQLHGVVHDGEFTVLQRLDSDNDVLSQEFTLDAQKVVTGGFAHLWGEDVAIEVSQDLDGTWYFRPRFERGSLDSFYDVETEDLAGQLVAVPVYSDSGQIEAFDITIEHLQVDIGRAEIEFRNHKKLVGNTKAIIDSGQWRVQASSIFDLFVSGNDWVGHGTIHLINMDNRVSLVDTETGASTHFQAHKLDTDLSIRLLRFNPINITGSLTELVDRGEMEFDNDTFSIQSDVTGGIGFREVRYPLVSLKVDQDLLEDPHFYDNDGLVDASLDALAPQGQEPGVDVDALIEKTFRPQIQSMESAARSVFQQIDFDMGDSMVGAAESLDSLSLNLEHYGIYAGAVYRKRGVLAQHKKAVFPMIQGFFSFLNPRILEGTELHLDEPRQVVEDNQLLFSEWFLNKPIRFLGMHIKGIEVQAPRGDSPQAARIQLITRHRKINLMWLFKLAFSRKMKGFYDRVDERLAEKHLLEGRGHQRLEKNEVPTDLGDLAIFADELMESLDWNRQIDRIKKREFQLFVAADFKDIPVYQMEALSASLSHLTHGLASQRSDLAASLLVTLNGLGRTPDMSSLFTSDFIDQTFSGDRRSQVLDILEEIEKLGTAEERREMGRRVFRLAVTDESESAYAGKNLKELNFKLLHLLSREFMVKPTIVDLEHLHRIDAQATVTPQPFDLGIARVHQTHEQSLDIDLTYMPGERDHSFDLDHPENEETPYLALRVGGDGEFLQGVGADFVNRSLFFRGDFDRMSGISLYLGGPIDQPYPLLFRVDDFSSSQDLEIVHRPDGMEGPAFALLTQDPEFQGLEHQTLIRGGDLFITRQGEFFDAGVTFHEAQADQGVLYITSQDQTTGELQNAYIRQTDMRYQDFDIRLGLETVPNAIGGVSYSFKDIHVQGGVRAEAQDEGPPRAYFFLGTNSEGEREYVELTRMNGEGEVDVFNSNITYSGNIEIESEIPEQILEHPAILALQDKGLSLDLDSIQIRGSFQFHLDGLLGGGITRLDPETVTSEFIPTELIFKGELGYEAEKHRITLTDLKVPLDTLNLSLFNMPDSEQVIPIVHELRINGEESITADVGAEMDLPVNVGSGLVGFEGASFTLDTSSGLDFSMDSPWSGDLETQGLEAHIQDRHGDNTIHLSAASIDYHGDAGTIRDWDVAGEFGELVQGVLLVAFSGDEAQFRLKKVGQMIDAVAATDVQP